MKKIIVSFLFISFSFASTVSDVRIEILSQIQILNQQKEEIIQKLKTETNKEKILDLRKKLQNIDKQIKSLREDLRTYENNIFTAG
ncbi:MAG TPA: hypothetical protein EYH43_00620 [Persephonella sp.]|nr:hypothetical protein [Hydrogenothermaceae bacterium]HIQ24472.1 hypothetical protein [Persephonella sp.]